jgi:hypothetical protein
MTDAPDRPRIRIDYSRVRRRGGLRRIAPARPAHHRSMALPFALFGGVIIVGAVADGVIGSTNKKTPR